MAGNVVNLGERTGARVFRLNRLGYDASAADTALYAYTGTFRTERVSPAGPDGLVNYRRVAIHLYSSGTYAYTVKVYVDNTQTRLGDGTNQSVAVSRALSVEGEYTDEVAIEAVGKTIQVEITVLSSGITAPFLIESITAEGRVIRGSASRAPRTS